MPYHTFSSYLKERYKSPVYKAALDLGLGCPNQDGTISSAGCIFCDQHQSGSAAPHTVAKQYEQLVARRHIDHPGEDLFIAYLQAGSNTYGDLQRLRDLYRQIRSLPNLVAVSIGTRPDLCGDQVLDLIAEEFAGLDIWIELGVQSTHDVTLRTIGRNHDYGTVQKASRRITEHGFNFCAHVILGLPDEDETMMLDTASRLGKLGINGIKLHPLFVAEGSSIEKKWRKGQFLPISVDNYVQLVVDFLERTSWDVVVQRLVGRGRPKIHLAPDWALSVRRTQLKIIAEFDRRGTRQGMLV